MVSFRHLLCSKMVWYRLTVTLLILQLAGSRPWLYQLDAGCMLTTMLATRVNLSMTLKEVNVISRCDGKCIFH